MMSKIRKNLTDADMLAQAGVVKEEPLKEQVVDEPSAWRSFLTPQLQEEIGRALLELKVKLYKQGIVNYQIKVQCQDDQILLKVKPKKS